MRHIERMEKIPHACAAAGSFDGVHLGHLAVIRALAEESRSRGLQSVVVSFACARGEEALTTELEKEYLFEKLGVDVMISLPAEQKKFTGKLLVEELGAEVVVTGAEWPERSLPEAKGTVLKIVDTVCADGMPVTAERVAEYLEAGDMENVSRLCGHPYFMLGKVVHGKALGRTVGMPTANLKIYGTKRRPPDGVYGTRTSIEGKYYSGVTNVGLRPSVDDLPEITIETMLADFDRDIYGEKIITEFPFYIREIQKFDGIEAVWRQVQKDMAQALEYFRDRLTDSKNNDILMKSIKFL